MKKKEYIKQMDVALLERIKNYLMENDLTLQGIDLDVLQAMEQEMMARDKGLHVLDGYLDPHSWLIEELRQEKIR